MKQVISGVSDPFTDSHLYEGSSVTRGLLSVSPALEAFVGEELHKEMLANKERRKAAEERRISSGSGAQPNPKAKAKKGG